MSVPDIDRRFARVPVICLLHLLDVCAKRVSQDECAAAAELPPEYAFRSRALIPAIRRAVRCAAGSRSPNLQFAPESGAGRLFEVFAADVLVGPVFAFEGPVFFVVA
jgi:hypothetical protein